jgi:Protein of unknown function (DUF664)
MTWTAPQPEAVDGPLVGPDRPMLEGYLGWQRATLLNICAGLSADQLALRPLASSHLSLLGLVRHATKVERVWFRLRAARQDVGPVYDLRLGKDHDFDLVLPEQASDALGLLQEEWRAADEAVAEMAFDDTFEVGEDVFSLRMTYVHMIGEYARHNGHADLLRESIDGVTAR